MENKNRQISMRLTSYHYEEIGSLIKKEHIKYSEWLRGLVLRELKEIEEIKNDERWVNRWILNRGGNW